MNMQQMLAQAQKMQRELQKAMNELKEKEFVINKNGMVVVTVTGNKEVKSIDIDNDAMDVDNKDMVQESIVLALNEAFAKIDAEAEAINERITGRAGGLF
ncbi:MAG: YbaB/EbfC family nucleoid-associated protein [Bacilli bacterium]|nr:YbaB/EbfC family nucleoid-associated protein [Erysipelotrichaceae bacterium]MDY5669617.1 YbaB/EbfC family nucleoid-associated protein [Bacilli bacterium]